MVTAGHSSNPTIHHSYAMPAGTWCSSSQAEMKVIKKASQIIQTEESPHKDRIASDSQSVLLHIANIQPAIPLKSADMSDILNLLAALNDERHQITVTWCPSHCKVVGNEMAEKQAHKGAAANQEDVWHNYDSAKATIRCATRWGNLQWKNLPGVLHERRKAWRTEKNQSYQGKSRGWWASEKWPPPGAQVLAAQNRVRSRHRLQRMRNWKRDSRTRRVWLPKNPPPAAWSDTTRHTSKRSPKGSENMGEVDLHPRSTWCLTARNHHHLLYHPAPHHHPFVHPVQYFTMPNCPPFHPRLTHPNSPQIPCVPAQQQSTAESHRMACVKVKLTHAGRQPESKGLLCIVCTVW